MLAQVTKDYLQINRANWDDAARVHADQDGYGIADVLADDTALSEVVRFDLPRLGAVRGLTALHLQCHIGTDTLSLHRLGAQMTGVDLSPVSIQLAQDLAHRAKADIDYVCADAYSAPEALGGNRI